MSMEVSLDAIGVVRWSRQESIPTLLWVIAFLAVIMMILLIILVMSIIVIRSRRMTTRNDVFEIEYGNNLEQHRPNYQQREKEQEKIANNDTNNHIYDYAISDHYVSSEKSCNEYSQEFPLLQCNQSFISNSKANIIH